MKKLQLTRFDWEDEINIANPHTMVAVVGAGTANPIHIHLWKMCFKNYKQLDANTIEINEKDEIAINTRLLEKIIERNHLFTKSNLQSINPLFDRFILPFYETEALFDKERTKEIYLSITMRLIEEARSQNVTSSSKALSRRTLAVYQRTLSLLLCVCSETPENVVRNYAPDVKNKSSYTTNYLTEDSVQPCPSQKEASLFVQLSQRHFDAIADAIENNYSYYFVAQKHLGYDNYVHYVQHSTETVKKAIETYPQYATMFDEDYRYIGRDVQLYNDLDKKNQQRYRNFERALLEKKESTSRIHIWMKHLSIHFTSLILFESGCNREQLAYINFDELPLSGTGPKRFLATKPRANYQDKPIWVSAAFIKTLRRYRDIRRAYLSEYATSYTAYGVKIKKYGRNETIPEGTMTELSAYAYKTTKLEGMPPEADIRSAFGGRKYTTVNFLEQTSGNTALVSSIVGRADATTRRHYLKAAQIDSVKSVSEFFTRLEEFVSYKNDKTDTRAPIIEDGEEVPAGHCKADDEDKPEVIDEVTEVVQNPRCGAPISCLFCKHYGVHGNERDIHQILSAKRWLEVQSETTSADIDEHLTKYRPYIERLNDIICDFRQRGEAFENAYQMAIEQVKSGKHSGYWKNKIEALIAMEEY